MRVLREADVRAVLDLRSCIDGVERAFVAYSTGKSEQPSVIHLDVPESGGEVHVKAGHLHGASHYAVKVASGFSALQRSDGLVIMFDARSGAPAAILLDNGFLTEQRTAAAGGVAARHLAPRRVEAVGVIGTGAQARVQLDALAVERGFKEVRIWGRSHLRAQRCVEDLRERPGLPSGSEYLVAPTVRDAVDSADVVITCTASREPLVRGDWLAPGAHVTAVGSDGADKQELHLDVLARADLLVVDSRAQCSRIGELHHALEAGVVEEHRAVEIGEICAQERPGRTRADQLTVCDLTGLGVQDVAAGAIVLRRAEGRGREIPL